MKFVTRCVILPLINGRSNELRQVIGSINVVLRQSGSSNISSRRTKPQYICSSNNFYPAPGMVVCTQVCQHFYCQDHLCHLRLEMIKSRRCYKLENNPDSRKSIDSIQS
jgi:hypothetical protein